MLHTNYLVFLLIFFFACDNQNEFSQQEGIIDHQYLESDWYLDFKKRAQSEHQHALKERQEFIRFVRAQKCNVNDKAQPLPLLIDAEQIAGALGKEPVNSLEQTSLFGQDQVYYLLEEIADKVECRFIFLTCEIDSFKKCLIWYAAKRSGELKQLHMLTVYKKTHTFKVEPEIWVEAKEIIINVRRTAIYPFEILNTHKIRYRIEDDGRISYSGSY